MDLLIGRVLTMFVMWLLQIKISADVISFAIQLGTLLGAITASIWALGKIIAGAKIIVHDVKDMRNDIEEMKQDIDRAFEKIHDLEIANAKR